MASSSMLLYVLLALWLLPAVLLIAVYCTDAAWDGARRAMARWHCYWAQRAFRQRADAHAAILRRRAAVVAGWAVTASAIPHSESRSASDPSAPYVVAGPSVRVPLVLEDETGRRHVRQWTLGLN